MPDAFGDSKKVRMQQGFPAGQANHGLISRNRCQGGFNIADCQRLACGGTVAPAMFAVQVAAVCDFKKQPAEMGTRPQMVPVPGEILQLRAF